MNSKASKGRTALSWIGIWATIWWGVSCLYILLLVWAGRSDYVTVSERVVTGSALANWRSAISTAYHDNAILPLLLALIILGWVAGGCLWLIELKRQNISYKAAFKDLFFTIR